MIESEFRRVFAAIIEIGDLERAGENAEARNDDLPVARQAVEKHLAQQSVRRLILEDAGSRDARAPDARAAEQLAPSPGGFRVCHIDSVGIERDTTRAQARDGDEGAGAVAVF